MGSMVGLAALVLWAALVFPVAGEAQPAAQEWAPGDVFKDCAECPEMVVLPSGTFRMGSEDDAEGDGSPRPVREVAVAAFALGRFEVTQGQYAAFVDATGRPTDDGCDIRVLDDTRSTFRAEWNVRLSWRAPGFDQNENHPVACVSWVDATAYVAWLSGLTGHKYRLPSEAEWEFAARAGTATRFYWGDDLECGYANIMDRSWQGGVAPSWPLGDCHDRARYTAPVGSFSPNAFGLHDMVGNVWEWTADCWHDDDDDSNAPGDGTPWLVDGGGDCGDRPVRGYSWDNTWRWELGSDNGNVAVRLRRSIGRVADTFGFRVARTLE